MSKYYYETTEDSRTETMDDLMGIFGISTDYERDIRDSYEERKEEENFDN